MRQISGNAGSRSSSARSPSPEVLGGVHAASSSSGPSTKPGRRGRPIWIAAPCSSTAVCRTPGLQAPSVAARRWTQPGILRRKMRDAGPTGGTLIRVCRAHRVCSPWKRIRARFRARRRSGKAFSTLRPTSICPIRAMSSWRFRGRSPSAWTTRSSSLATSEIGAFGRSSASRSAFPRDDTGSWRVSASRRHPFA